MQTKRFLDILFLSALMVYILAGVPVTPFHGDESTLIHTTRDYAYQFIDRDLSMVMLNANPAIDPMDQQLRLIDGRVHKYLGGLAWHLRGYTINDINTAWLWGTDWDYNLQEGHIPSHDLLITTRYASAILMAAGVVIMFLIGNAVGGRRVGYAAALLYTIHPALLLNGRRSMMEGSLMFFTLLTVLAGMRWIKPAGIASVWGRIGRGLLLGLAAGLALSSKHTAILTIAPVFAVCGLYALYHRRIPAITSLIVSGLLALGVFYALNPTLWGDPLTGFRELLRLRTETLSTQLMYFDSYDDFGQKIDGFARYTLNSSPQYYEIDEWANFIGDQITAYESSGLNGLSIGIIANLLFLAAGILVLFRERQLLSPERLLLLGWTLTVVVATLVITPFQWQRYYLPAILPLLVIMALSIRFALPKPAKAD